MLAQVALCLQGECLHKSSDITPGNTELWLNETVPKGGGTIKSGTLSGNSSTTIV